MDITITKGKIIKGDRVEIEYLKNETTDAKPAECSEKHLHPPHPDLKKAFDALILHAMLIGEFIPASSIKNINKPDPEQVKDFTVTGFTVVGEGMDEGFILSARKTLKSGKTLGFNCPKILLESEAETAYEFAEDLALCVADCKLELEEYLNGKFLPETEDPQGKLFTEDNEDNKENLLVPKKKLRRRNKEKELI